MLKLTYTDMGLCLEQLSEPIEVVVSRRALLAVRIGQPLYVQNSRASFLLAATALQQSTLEHRIRTASNPSDSAGELHICPVDDHYVEVSIPGVWIADEADAHDGTFVTRLGDRIEACLIHLWRAQGHLSVLSRP